MTRIDNLAAQTLLEQAIAIDPNYAQARAVLAVSHMFGVQMGWGLARAACRLPSVTPGGDPGGQEDPWAHFALAMVYSHSGSIEDTLAEYELALRLNPNFALAQACYALVLIWGGRVREGAAAADRAIRLSPRDPFSAIYYAVASYAAYVERDYGESIRLGRESIRQRNDFVAAHRVITAAAGMTGDPELAKSTLKEFRRVHPDVSLALVQAGFQSAIRPSASISWKACAAPAWSSRGRPPGPRVEEDRKSAVSGQIDAIEPEWKSNHRPAEPAFEASNSTAFAISSVAVQLRVSQMINENPVKCQSSIPRLATCPAL